MEDDANTPLPSGWLPPQAPTHHVSDAAPPRPPGSWPRDPNRPAEPSTPAAVFAIAFGASSIVLLVVSVGLSFSVSLMLSATALWIGTRLRHAIAAGRPGARPRRRPR